MITSPERLGSVDGGALNYDVRASSTLQRNRSSGRRGPAENTVTSQPLAEWHGQVSSMGGEYFVAELRGVWGDGVAGEHEEATIPIAEVPDDDRTLITPGAFFRLCVSRERAPHGTLRRSTYVVFRRMPAYRREELEDALVRAREIVRGLRLE